jgi:hypothetical protein
VKLQNQFAAEKISREGREVFEGKKLSAFIFIRNFARQFSVLFFRALT